MGILGLSARPWPRNCCFSAKTCFRTLTPNSYARGTTNSCERTKFFSLMTGPLEIFHLQQWGNWPTPPHIWKDKKWGSIIRGLESNFLIFQVRAKLQRIQAMVHQERVDRATIQQKRREELQRALHRSSGDGHHGNFNTNLFLTWFSRLLNSIEEEYPGRKFVIILGQLLQYYTYVLDNAKYHKASRIRNEETPFSWGAFQGGKSDGKTRTLSTALKKDLQRFIGQYGSGKHTSNISVTTSPLK